MKKSDNIVLLDIDDTLFNTEQLKESEFTRYELYDEVKNALSLLSQIATLGIFSQGEIAFQKKKLRKTTIDHYFSEEHLHIVDYKVGVVDEVLRLYSDKANVFFIDDRLEGLHEAKKSNPSVFTIWMKRGRYVATQEEHADFTPDAVIKNLAEAIPLIARQ